MGKLNHHLACQLWWCSSASYTYRSETSSINVQKSNPLTVRPGKTLLQIFVEKRKKKKEPSYRIRNLLNLSQIFKQSRLVHWCLCIVLQLFYFIIQSPLCRIHNLDATLPHTGHQWNISASHSWIVLDQHCGIRGVTLYWQGCKWDQNLASPVPLQSYLRAELKLTGKNVHLSAKPISLLNLRLHMFADFLHEQ